MDTLARIRQHANYHVPLGPNPDRGVVAGFGSTSAARSTGARSGFGDDGTRDNRHRQPRHRRPARVDGMMATAEVLGVPWPSTYE